MKTIGIIGGLSWESSAEYYGLINRMVRQRLGGSHSAKLLLLSLDFSEIQNLQHRDAWDELGVIMAASAQRLEDAGADLLLIAANTMHLLADHVQDQVDIPLIHIADACGREITRRNIIRVGLLGTRFTMEKDFLRQRLAGSYGLEVLVPGEKEREEIHRIIYEELVRGEFLNASAERLAEICGGLTARGVQGIILGCTELPLVLKPSMVDVPLFDSLSIHAAEAVDFALRGVDS